MSTLSFASNPVYLSDIAVDFEYRHLGIAKKMLSLFFDQNKEKEWVITTTKTGVNPSFTNAWFYRSGFSLLLPYNDKLEREIQFAKILDILLW